MELINKPQIQADMIQYLKDHSISQKDFSSRAGVPKEYISSIANGVFDYNAGKGKVHPINDRHFKSILKFIKPEESKEWRTIVTPQLTMMLSELQDAKEHAYTRVLIGETGCGKSFVKDIFQRKNPTEVIAITVGSEDTIASLLNKVCLALRAPQQGRTSAQKIRDISLALEAIYHHGKKPMLVFDESEYMKPRALCNIKEFYDHLEGFCSIVLIGTKQLINEIDKLRKKDAKGIPQLYRRIKFGIRHLPRVNRSFSEFLEDIQDKPLKKFLQRECNNYGELHDILVPSIREAKRLQRPLDLELVRKVIGMDSVMPLN
jgi:DNA transposition AAA+ family ATPase